MEKVAKLKFLAGYIVVLFFSFPVFFPFFAEVGA